MDMTIVAGKIGKDAEIKTLQNGKSVINFSVASKKTYKNAQGEYATQWFECSKWVNDANTNLVGLLKKGTSVSVKGEVSARAYSGSDNVAKAVLVLNVESVELLGSGQNQNQESGGSQFRQNAMKPNDNFDNEEGF